MTTAERIDHLEEHAARTEERLRRLELAAAPERPPVRAGRAFGPPVAASRSVAPPAAAPRSVAPLVPASAATLPTAPRAERPRGRLSDAPERPRPTLEELLGGRVLAWVGGAAVLVGLALLFALGISNGWIGEGTRCVIEAVGCAALLGLGVRLHERAGRTEAARAAVATALSGLFLTLVVATVQYALLPEPVGLASAVAIGALAVALAARWKAPVIAALGIVGALLAPAFAGQTGESGGLGFLAVAAVAALAVIVWRRWTWVSVCVALVVTPQWLGWMTGERSAGAILLVLVAFGALQALAAVGTALRAPKDEVAGVPAALLAINALVLGLAGWYALLENGSRTDATLWLAGLAAAHLALGVAARRSARLSGDLGLLCLALGVVLTDVAFALATHGVAQAFGWAISAVAFAGLARLSGVPTDPAAADGGVGEAGGAAATGGVSGLDGAAAEAGGAAATGGASGKDGAAAEGGPAWDGVAAASGLGLHVGLALLSATQAIDTATFLAGGAPSAAATAILAALAGSCLVSARLAPTYRLALDVLGLVAVAVLTALTLDGVALTAAWALEAAALCSLGARGEGDGVAWFAGLAHLAAAATWCLADQASPAGLSGGVPDLGAAVLAVGAVLAATARLAALADEDDRPLVLGALAVGALYLASLVVVDVGGADLRAAQLRLSGLWAVVGVGALVAGLRRDRAPVRTGALALLGLTIGKVFVYDLATQEASYRVASFLGLGILLLGAAFAYQRLRPEAPRDLREVPPALR